MKQTSLLVLRISVVVIMAATLFAAGLVVFARSQHLQILSVQTGSMRPAIRPGDAVLVRQPDNLAVGDIISYRSPKNPDALITHRLVAIDARRGTLTARGDALDVSDPPIGGDRVVGVVARTVPLAGYGFDFIRNPIGLAAAVYAPSVILIVWEIRRLMQFYSRQHYRVYYY